MTFLKKERIEILHTEMGLDCQFKLNLMKEKSQRIMLELSKL
jgi:hypothetical protein